MSRFLWTQKEDIGPSARFGHAMAYDSMRSRTTLFGGSLLIGGQSVNDTWEWNSEFWTQMADSGPAARQDHALCFDPSAHGMVFDSARGRAVQRFLARA